MFNQLVPTVDSVVGPRAYRSAAGPVVSAYIGAIDDEGERFAAVAEAGDLDAPIAACPGWAMRDLVEHLGLVHLWAATNIVVPSSNWLTINDMADLRPYWPDLTDRRPDDHEFVSWYRATLTTLIGVLEATPADHECLTFLPARSPLEMWARRQASEIAVHRHDAEAARGCTTGFDPRFAADMLDELLVGFAPKMPGADGAEDRVLRVQATDVDEQFFVTMGRTGIRTSREGGGAHLHMTGTASDLYVMLWNRPAGPSITCEGDPAVLDLWRRACQIRWC